MEFEVLEQCFQLKDEIKSVKILKSGNRACFATRDDMVDSKRYMEKWLLLNKRLSNDNYEERLVKALDQREFKYSPTTFIAPAHDDWFDSRIIVEETLRAYNTENSINWGKIFDDDGVIQYWGEIMNGKAHGSGKLLYPTGIPEYEGTFVNNVIEGRGCYYSESGCMIYRGDFKEGVRSGHGVEFYHTGGKMYEGEWFYDKWHGKGAWWNVIGDIIYRGDFEYGEPNKYRAENKYGNSMRNDPKLVTITPEKDDFRYKSYGKGSKSKEKDYDPMIANHGVDSDKKVEFME